MINTNFKSCLVTRYKTVFKASALWADAFYKSKFPSVRLCVRLSVCLFTFLLLLILPYKTWWKPRFQMD